MHLSVDRLDIADGFFIFLHIDQRIDDLQVVDEIMALFAQLHVEFIQLFKGFRQHLGLFVSLFPDKAVAHRGQPLKDEHHQCYRCEGTQHVHQVLIQIKGIDNEQADQQHHFNGIDDDRHGGNLADIDLFSLKLHPWSPPFQSLFYHMCPLSRN